MSLLEEMWSQTEGAIIECDNANQRCVMVQTLAEQMVTHAGEIGQGMIIAAGTAVVDAAVNAIEAMNNAQLMVGRLGHAVQNAGSGQ